jgi:hypothetical protein
MARDLEKELVAWVVSEKVDASRKGTKASERATERLEPQCDRFLQIL